MPESCISKANITHIVWDWNGTLLRDVGICIETANEMLAERGLAPLQCVEDYRRVFTFPVIEYYRLWVFNLYWNPLQM